MFGDLSKTNPERMGDFAYSRNPMWSHEVPPPEGPGNYPARLFDCGGCKVANVCTESFVFGTAGRRNNPYMSRQPFCVTLRHNRFFGVRWLSQMRLQLRTLLSAVLWKYRPHESELRGSRSVFPNPSQHEIASVVRLPRTAVISVKAAWVFYGIRIIDER